MNRSGKEKTSPIVLMSREDSPIHGIVKRLADKYGFLWHQMPNFPLSRNAAIVLVASTGDKKMFSELSDKCGVWNQNEQTACACYELEVGNGVPVLMSDDEPLTDWILAESVFYEQNKIGFEGANELSAEQLCEFETVLEYTLLELIEAFTAKKKPIIKKSPFVKSIDAEDGCVWSIEVNDPVTNRTVSTSISPYALLNSLGEERGEQDLFTCDCGVPECARIYHTKFFCTEQYVHWSFEELGTAYSLFFDRIAYERAAIEMLHNIYDTKEGWKFNAAEYWSYEDFKSAVDEFLAAKPYFKTIWNEIEETSI